MNFLYESEQYTELIESLCEAELELNEYQNMSLLVNQEGINIPLPGKLGYHVERITSKLNNIQDYFTNRLNTFLIGTDKAIKKIEEKYSKMSPEEKKSPREIKIYKQEYFDKFIQYCETQISVVKTIINKPGDPSNASRMKALADNRKATKIGKIGYDYGNNNKPYKKTMTAEETYKLFKKNMSSIQKIVKGTISVAELFNDKINEANVSPVIKERKYCSTIIIHLFRVIDKLTNETVLGCYDTILDGNKRLLVDIMKYIGGEFITSIIKGAMFGRNSNDDTTYATESYETAITESGLIDYVNSLEDVIKKGQASDEDIKTIEKELGLTLAKEYKQYLRNFGAIICGSHELTGISKSRHTNVITVTQRSWELNPQVPKSMYAIEDTGVDGIIIWQDSKGNIYTSTPTGKPKKSYSSLLSYIKKCK